VQWLHYLALSLWIGGITFLSAAAAPAAHSSMASRAVAGQIVAKILRRLNAIELVCCTLLLVTSLSSFRFVRERQSWLWYLILVILLMGILTCYYRFYLTPRLESIKEEVPTLETLSPEHPSKVEFNKLHRLYVKLMSLNLVLGLMALYGSVVILK
jgi:hypothetical protein